MGRVLSTKIVNQEKIPLIKAESQVDVERLIPACETGSRGRGHIDQGWAWFVVLGSSIGQLLVIAMLSSFGLLYVPLTEELHIGLGEVTMIGNILFGVTYITVALTSPICERVGCRILTCIGAILMFGSFFTGYLVLNLDVMYFIGAVAGLGGGLVMASGLMVVNGYFDRKRHVAFSLILAANGTGGVIAPPIVSFLLKEFGLRNALLLISAIYLHGLIGGMLLRPVPDSAAHVSTHKTASLSNTLCSLVRAYRVYLDKALFGRVLFYLCAVSSCLYCMGYVVTYAILPDYMTTQNFSLEDASTTLLLAGVANAMGKLVGMIFVDRCPRWSRVLYVCSAIMCGTSLLTVPVCQDISHYFIAAAGFGFFYGSIHFLGSMLYVEFFGPDKLPGCFGISYLAYTVASFTGNPLSQLISDMTSLTGAKFYVAGSAVVASGLIMTGSFFIKIDRSSRSVSNISMTNNGADSKDVASSTSPRISPLEVSVTISEISSRKSALSPPA